MPAKKQKLELKTLAFDMTSSTDASIHSAQGRVMKGYASTWSMDLGGDIIEPGAFDACIAARFTAQVLSRGYGRIRFMNEHKTVIGRILFMRPDLKGLYVECYFSTTRLGNDICTLVTDNALDQMSIGFVVPAGGSYLDKKGNRHITEIDCQEVSVVTFPMNEETDIISMKGSETPYTQEVTLSKAETALNTEEANTLLEHEIKSMAYHLSNAALEIKKGKKLSAETTGKLMKVLATVHEVLSSSMSKNVNEEDDELTEDETEVEREIREGEEADEGKDMGVTGAAPLRSVFATENLGNQKKPMKVAKDPVTPPSKKNSNSNLSNVEGIVDPIAKENPSNPQTSPKGNNEDADTSNPAAQDDSSDSVTVNELDSNTQDFDGELAAYLESVAVTLANFR